MTLLEEQHPAPVRWWINPDLHRANWRLAWSSSIQLAPGKDLCAQLAVPSYPEIPRPRSSSGAAPSRARSSCPAAPLGGKASVVLQTSSYPLRESSKIHPTKWQPRVCKNIKRYSIGKWMLITMRTNHSCLMTRAC